MKKLFGLLTFLLLTCTVDVVGQSSHNCGHTSCLGLYFVAADFGSESWITIKFPEPKERIIGIYGGLEVTYRTGAGYVYLTFPFDGVGTMVFEVVVDKKITSVIGESQGFYHLEVPVRKDGW